MKSKPTALRNGMASIVVLVALAILAVTLGVVTVQVVKQRQTLAARQRGLQADWLARAGFELAAARLLQAPASFRDERKDLADDSRLRIAAEKSGDDLFVIQVEAEVGIADGPTAARGDRRRYRRRENGGVIRLELVGPEK